MKLISILPMLAAVCTVLAPFSAEAKDKHDKHRDNHHDNHERHDRDHHGSHVTIRPSYGHGHGNGYGRGYGGYGGYGYGSSYYRSPYYYGRPSLGFSYYSRPSSGYRGQSAYRSYSDSLAVDVQSELRRRGYYRGPIDGDIGPGSRAAIRNYQYDRGLSATGRIDSSLLRALGIS